MPLKKLKEKDLLKSTIRKWLKELKLKNSNKKDSEWSMNKDKRLRDLREKKESRNTDLSKKKERQRDKLELLLREKSMKKELN